MFVKNAGCLMSCSASKEKKGSSVSCALLASSVFVYVWSNQPVFTCCVQHSGIETPQHQTLISPNTGSERQFRIWKVRISILRSRLSRPSFLDLTPEQNQYGRHVSFINRFIHRQRYNSHICLISAVSVRAVGFGDSFEETPKYL